MDPTFQIKYVRAFQDISSQKNEAKTKAQI